MKDVLIDTGPLVALLSRSDRHHRWARQTFAQARVPAFTVDAVVSECLYLLRRDRLDPKGLFELVAAGILAVEANQTSRVVELCRQYADVPMSWADAGLIALSEARPTARLVTFDEDFTVYRRFSRERVPLLRPAARP